ncbi:hypothetical protein [Sphingobium sp. YC-XJ3]|uniref:hypothetical protein n=1 Tax=Sphingobium sp. YC-XJ3 TaxID=3024245 RepID=UPI0023606FA1|nr:hypothetical protein [Sphingobium sp. YC-XJ3]WDA36434.1 hypothetical protein PO876_23895 [Sphingobium sp. YC-XJ3]
MSYMPTSEEIRAEMEAMPGLGEMQAINRIRSREELRRVAFRHYPNGSFGPSIRSQMAESIDAFMALGRREEK